MMSLADHMTICMDSSRIDSRCSFGEEFIELIHINPSKVLYLIFNQVDLSHGCIHGP